MGISGRLVGRSGRLVGSRVGSSLGSLDASLNTTAIYLQFNDKDLQDVYERVPF